MQIRHYWKNGQGASCRNYIMVGDFTVSARHLDAHSPYYYAEHANMQCPAVATEAEREAFILGYLISQGYVLEDADSLPRIEHCILLGSQTLKVAA